MKWVIKRAIVDYVCESLAYEDIEEIHRVRQSVNMWMRNKDFGQRIPLITKIANTFTVISFVTFIFAVWCAIIKYLM